MIKLTWLYADLLHCSSLPSEQSLCPSHNFPAARHSPEEHWNSFRRHMQFASSELSKQSVFPSHWDSSKLQLYPKYTKRQRNVSSAPGRQNLRTGFINQSINQSTIRWWIDLSIGRTVSRLVTYQSSIKEDSQVGREGGGRQECREGGGREAGRQGRRKEGKEERRKGGEEGGGGEVGG